MTQVRAVLILDHPDATQDELGEWLSTAIDDMTGMWRGLYVDVDELELMDEQP